MEYEDLRQVLIAESANIVAMYCTECSGVHIPDDENTWVDWNGTREFGSFHCFCCKRQICARQYSYGRACGYCDSGSCKRQHFSDPFTEAVMRDRRLHNE
jgi:hypothetical protein